MSDDTMTELERLRADMEVLERYKRDREADFYGDVVIEIRERIARLEAEQADPWRGEKAIVDTWRITNHGSETHYRMARFFDHLTAENERLAARVAELESNAVWGIHSQVDGHLIQAFNTRAEAEAELEKEPPKFRFREVKVSCAKSIVKALNETQKAENRYRVERDAAWRRVKELEAEIATADEIQTDYSNFSQSAKEAYEKAHKPLADMQPPFEGPIVGLEPILDPDRVLATAADVLMTIPTTKAWRERFRQIAIELGCVKDLADAKPYRLKGAENGS